MYGAVELVYIPLGAVDTCLFGCYGGVLTWPKFVSKPKSAALFMFGRGMGVTG